MLFSFFGFIWKKMPRNARRRITRLFQTSFTVSAAGIVTNGSGEVLLLDHVLRPYSGWGLPGGFMNLGEQPKDALCREIREETGIELENVSIVHVRTLHQHIEIIFVARGVGEPKVKSREITALGWFAVENMPAELSKNERSLIKQALEQVTAKK